MNRSGDGEDLAPFCQDCASPTQNKLAGGSRRDAISILPQKDGESDVALKAAYLLTDGSLEAVHLLSSPREVFTFVDSDQIFEMGEILPVLTWPCTPLVWALQSTPLCGKDITDTWPRVSRLSTGHLKVPGYL